MDLTLRRPAIAAVKPDARFSDRLLVELPFPNSLEVIDRLLFAYLDEQRRPGHALFVLDTSGSMSGERIQQLKTALVNLAGADPVSYTHLDVYKRQDRTRDRPRGPDRACA